MSNRAAGIVIRASSFLRHCSFRHSSFFHVYLSDSNFAVTYDDGGRVTTWQRDDPAAPLGYNGQQNWTYDGAGNWASTDIGNSTQNREHDNSDQLTKIGGNNLQYTLTGCLTHDHHGNQYSWDIDNRLSAKTNDSQLLGTADYQYDVLGRRVAKDSGGGSWGKTVTLWWNMREVADYKTTGSTPGPIHHYLNLPRHNDRLARTVQVGSSEQVQYYHKNYLDHVYTITDEDGDALEHIRYTAFGLPTYYDFSGLKVATSPTGNQFLWNGKRLDPQLGWYLYHYRHYSPELGRWPSRDPIGEDGGVNLYGFVGNGPLYAWDWLGLDPYWIERNKGLPPSHIARHARRCMDCHGHPAVLREGRMPFDQPWFIDPWTPWISSWHELDIVFKAEDEEDIPKIREQIYEDLTKFRYFSDPRNRGGDVELKGAVAKFSGPPFLKVVQEWSSKVLPHLTPYNVVTLTFEPDNYTVKGHTQPGHIITGTREWSVTKMKDEPCGLTLRTSATERSSDPVVQGVRNVLGIAYVDLQKVVWDDYFTNIGAYWKSEKEAEVGPLRRSH